MSSTLDDFFGSSETAVVECLYCGGTDGKLIAAIFDNNGPTHYCHSECKTKAQAERSAPGSRDLPDFDRDTAVNGIE